MIRIKLDSDSLNAALARMLAGIEDQTEVMNDIGEWLVKSARKNFDEGTGPDGKPWTPNSPVTLARKSDPRPLHRELNLYRSISYESGRDHVEIGSVKDYAAMMQFGGAKSAFPHLWGDIPARPYIGVSDDDETAILAIVTEWLSGLADGTD